MGIKQADDMHLAKLTHKYTKSAQLVIREEHSSTRFITDLLHCSPQA